MPGEGVLLCLGNPLLDISSNVDAAFLAKYDVGAAVQLICGLICGDVSEYLPPPINSMSCSSSQPTRSWPRRSTSPCTRRVQDVCETIGATTPSASSTQVFLLSLLCPEPAQSMPVCCSSYPTGSLLQACQQMVHWPQLNSGVGPCL
jgi:hypothetical protein